MFLTQALVVPALVAAKLLAAVVPFELEHGWLDVDAMNTSAVVGRSIAFGATAVLVFVPAQLHRSRPTTLGRVAALAPWLFIAFAMAAFLLLLAGLALSRWTD